MSSAIAKFEPSNLEELMKFSAWLSKSALIPRALQGKPADIAIVLMKGHDLGLTSMQALGSIDVIEGKPSLSAELVVALCLKHAEVCEMFEMVESTEAKAVYKAKRKGGGEQRLTYTIEQAKNAGLTNKDNWKRHTASMLRSRASKALAKVAFPDLVLGVITPDEAEEIESSLERELNPSPQVPAGGQQKQTEKLKALVKSKPAIIDVAPGETEEDAEARVSREPGDDVPPPDEADEPFGADAP